MKPNRPPNNFTEPECACFTLRKANRLVSQLYNNALRPAGLRNTQFTILRALESRGAQTLGELAGVLVTDRTTVTRNLRPLERDGLICSRTGVDRRVRDIEITADGKATLQRALPLWRDAQQRLRERLGAGELEQLVGDLQSAIEELRAS